MDNKQNRECGEGVLARIWGWVCSECVGDLVERPNIIRRVRAWSNGEGIVFNKA